MYMDEKFVKAMNEVNQEKEFLDQQEAYAHYVMQGINERGEIELDGEKIIFEEVTLLENRLRMRLPQNFSTMGPKLAAQKYPSDNRPHLIYSDPTGALSLAFTDTQSPVSNEEIANFRDFLLTNLQRMQPEMKFLTTGLKELGTKKIGHFDFISVALDTLLYNLTFVVELSGQALLGSFNCPEKQIDKWQPIAHGMIASITFLEDNVKNQNLLGREE